MKYIRLSLIVFAICLLTANLYAGEVAQGKCTAYDKAKGQMTIEEYDISVSKENPYGKATGNVLQFDCSSAKIGIPPATGDVMRIAYVKEGDILKAKKIMNVSKQDLRKK